MSPLVATAATLAGDRKRLAALFVAFGLISSSAVLVHLWGGVIEAHFHFFVMIVCCRCTRTGSRSSSRPRTW